MNKPFHINQLLLDEIVEEYLKLRTINDIDLYYFCEKSQQFWMEYFNIKDIDVSYNYNMALDEASSASLDKNCLTLSSKIWGNAESLEDPLKLFCVIAHEMAHLDDNLHQRTFQYDENHKRTKIEPSQRLLRNLAPILSQVYSNNKEEQKAFLKSSNSINYALYYTMEKEKYARSFETDYAPTLFLTLAQQRYNSLKKDKLIDKKHKTKMKTNLNFLKNFKEKSIINEAEQFKCQETILKNYQKPYFDIYTKHIQTQNPSDISLENYETWKSLVNMQNYQECFDKEFCDKVYENAKEKGFTEICQSIISLQNYQPTPTQIEDTFNMIENEPKEYSNILRQLLKTSFEPKFIDSMAEITKDINPEKQQPQKSQTNLNTENLKSC